PPAATETSPRRRARARPGSRRPAHSPDDPLRTSSARSGRSGHCGSAWPQILLHKSPAPGSASSVPGVAPVTLCRAGYRAQMPAPALADELAAMDDDALATLLRARPALAVPRPADSEVLATRAGIPASVARACEDLDRFVLAVLTAAVVAEGDVTPVPRNDI